MTSKRERILKIQENAMMLGYVECMLWAENLDRQTIEDLDLETLNHVIEDCHNFYEENKRDLTRASVEHAYDLSQADADFWLTRNRHGAGFWDRGLKDIGTRLSNNAHNFGPKNVELSEDGKVVVF